MASSRAQRIKNAVRANFDVSAAAYEEFERTFGLFGELAARLASLGGISRGQRVLDVGCGTGDSCAILSSLVGEGGLVVGLDCSASMLRRAARRSPPGEGGLILLVQADGEDPGIFAPGSFDAVLYNASAFLLPDAARSFASAVPVLSPGGVVAVSVLQGLVDSRSGEDLIERFRTDDQVGMRDGRIVDPSRLGETLASRVGPVRTARLRRRGGSGEARAFYRIPAQSASLFPRRPVAERLSGVDRLFDAVAREGYDPVLQWSLHAARGSGGEGAP